MHLYCGSALTSLWALVELVHEGERVLDNIQNGQQSACETQKLTKTIETKVNQVTSQIHHLEERSKTRTPLKYFTWKKIYLYLKNVLSLFYL